MRSFQPYGMVIPMLTPFHKDGSVDEAAVRRLARRLMAAGVQGLFPVGSTGEFFALSWQERCRIIEVVIGEVNGRVPVYAGTGGVGTQEVVELTRRAEKMGADAIVVITPFYISPTQDELYAHYAAICASTTLPVIPYNNPGRTGGVNLEPATVVRMATTLPNLVGIKDSSGKLQQTLEYIKQCPSTFRVFQGRDELLHPSFKGGAVGGVAATGNVAPELVMEIYKAHQAADEARGAAAQEKLTVLRDALALGTFPSVLKAAMEMLGEPVGPPRMPVAPLADTQRASLRTMLQGIGLAVGS
jgi:4-hydroxy-tetrahydrodipicolinate synthase